MNIDLTQLNEEQLTALAMVVDPDIIRQERTRRRSYGTMAEAMHNLEEAFGDFIRRLEKIRNTKASQVVKESNILTVIDSVLITARVHKVIEE